MRLPPSRRVIVDDFDALLTTPLADGVNAVCWPRAAAGDFDEVARLLAPSRGMVTVEPADLMALPQTPGVQAAVAVLLEDLRRLESLGRDPILNCIIDYAADDRGFPIATDVMSFHVDRAPVEVDTWLCTWSGPPTEGLDTADAIRLVNDPARRAALLALHGGDDDDTFAAFLSEGSFDLHYAPVPGARPWSFGVGHLWRIAVDWPGARVPPCIHRAPRTMPGDAPRLLLIC